MFISQGLRLVHSGAVSQANMKLASVAGGAMIDIGVDWTAYAGDDAGVTDYMLILYDSSGKRMQGFCGASGAGEALGAEIITNSDYEAALASFDDDTVLRGTMSQSTDQAVSGTKSGRFTSSGLSPHINYQDSDLSKVVANALYKTHFYFYGLSAEIYIPHLYFNDGSGNIRIINGIAKTDSWQEYSRYAIPFTQCLFDFYLYNALAGEKCYLDDFSLKRVTEVSVQGVHLHSTRGGVDRNVASIDTDFDLNDVSGYTFKLYKCS